MLLLGGWSFSVYIIQLVCRNLQLILKEHWHLAIGKVTVIFLCNRNTKDTVVHQLSLGTILVKQQQISCLQKCSHFVHCYGLQDIQLWWASSVLLCATVTAL